MRHELATANSEQLLFDNIAALRDDKPGSSNMDDRKAARLNASEPDRRIGTAIMLRVIKGDEFTFATDAYYEADESPQDYEHSTAEEIVSSLLSTLASGTAGGKPVSETPTNEIINEIFSRPDNISGIGDIINSSMINSTTPRAGLNYLFFDEQMNLISGSGRLVVGLNPNDFENLSSERVTTTEPGILIVYVDNQTMGKDVWFDNVQVLHYNTQVLEENHYYPFGLTLSTTAMGITKQPLKYQTKELEKSFGLEMYDFHARMYDPQLGRFNSIDPLAHKFADMSPYAGMGNNPVLYSDPDGMEFIIGDGNKASKLDNEFFDLLNARSGKIFKMDEKGYVGFDEGKSLDDVKNGNGVSLELATAVANGFSEGTQDVYFRTVNNSETVDFDSYKTGAVDVADFKAMDKNSQAALLGHFITERYATEGYETNKESNINTYMNLKNPKDRDNSKFGQAHSAGIKTEASIVGTLTGTKNDGTRNEIMNVDGRGTGSVKQYFIYSDRTQIIYNQNEKTYKISGGKLIRSTTKQ